VSDAIRRISRISQVDIIADIIGQKLKEYGVPMKS
jgi:hypothetical protein